MIKILAACGAGAPVFDNIEAAIKEHGLS